MGQLVEWSLPTPEVHGSNPVISKIYNENLYRQLHWKDKNKEKEARNGPFFRKKYFFILRILSFLDPWTFHNIFRRFPYYRLQFFHEISKAQISGIFLNVCGWLGERLKQRLECLNLAQKKIEEIGWASKEK